MTDSLRRKDIGAFLHSDGTLDLLGYGILFTEFNEDIFVFYLKEERKKNRKKELFDGWTFDHHFA